MKTILETTHRINDTDYQIALTRDGDDFEVTINGERGIWDCDPCKVPDGCIVGMTAAWAPNDGEATEAIYDLLDDAIASALRRL